MLLFYLLPAGSAAFENCADALGSSAASTIEDSIIQSSRYRRRCWLVFICAYELYTVHLFALPLTRHTIGTYSKAVKLHLSDTKTCLLCSHDVDINLENRGCVLCTLCYWSWGYISVRLAESNETVIGPHVNGLRYVPVVLFDIEVPLICSIRNRV